MEKTSNPISAFHCAGPDNSPPLKLNLFETEQQGKLQSRYRVVTNHLSEVRLIESGEHFRADDDHIVNYQSGVSLPISCSTRFFPQIAQFDQDQTAKNSGPPLQYLRSFALSAVMKFPAFDLKEVGSLANTMGAQCPAVTRQEPVSFEAILCWHSGCAAMGLRTTICSSCSMDEAPSRVSLEIPTISASSVTSA